MSDETKPEGEAVETKHGTTTVATPEEGREPEGTEPSSAADEPSQDAISRDQYEAAVRAMNEAQRRAAALEDEAGKLREFAHVQLQRQREAENPEIALRERYMTTYDPKDLQAWLDARDRAAEDRITRRALQEFQVEDAVRQARSLGIESRDEMRRLAQSMTPEDFAIVKMHHAGKLREHLNDKHAEQEKRARRAKSLDVLSDGIGGGRSVPGTGGRPTRTVAFQDWVSMTKEARDRHRNADYDVLITDAPKHYDPNSD